MPYILTVLVIALGRAVSWALDRSTRKIKLPASPAVDAEIDLNRDGEAFFLRARLNVSIPGVEREVVHTLAEAAHGICPYSKAVHGNIEVTTKVV